ncbi:MAG TPA: potassium channel family protein [Terriglobia bacterium]|nr:potassium channel family protein [Terriglobia bacterium]
MLILILGCVLVLTVLWEAFETIILPRRVRRRFRLTRVYYRVSWWPFRGAVGRIHDRRRRDAWLGFFGPLSLLGLLTLWALALVVGFGLIHYGAGSHLRIEGEPAGVGIDLYASGTTFFTLGLGDAAPSTWLARALMVLEAGLGFGFLAIVIGYLPVIYQAFSRREVFISMLDARAGSPPNAAELLRRHAQDHTLEQLDALLRDWEHWSAELLESHLSYPVLAYFRSQHDNQSWLGALTTILDTSALVMAGFRGRSFTQARLTFAMARHTVVDLSQVFNTKPNLESEARLSDADLVRLHDALRASGLEPDDKDGQRLARLRRLYEPYVMALAEHLRMELPPWIVTGSQKDNWQTTAWGGD